MTNRQQQTNGSSHLIHSVRRKPGLTRDNEASRRRFALLAIWRHGFLLLVIMKIWLPESNVNLQLVRNKERGELAWQRPSQVPNVFGLHYISMTEVDYCLFACWPVLWTGISVRPPFISDGNAWWVRQVQTKRRQASRRAYQSHGRRRLEKPPTWTMPQLWSWPLTTSTWLLELLSSRQRIRICLPCYCKRRCLLR